MPVATLETVMEEVDLLASGRVHTPHAFLGVHSLSNHPSRRILRIWRPGATELYCEVKGRPLRMEKTDPRGLFTLILPSGVAPNDCQIWHASGLLAKDPYTFFPTVGELDCHLFSRGVHYHLYDVLGAHPTTVDGVAGVRFALWAPSACGVALVADFNHWDGRVNPMRTLGHSGIWELFVPGLVLGEKYKFEVRDAHDRLHLKSDPYGNQFEERPKSAAVVADFRQFAWSDKSWLSKRTEQAWKPQPLTIYELHIGSWRRQENGSHHTYRSLAPQLVEYCQQMHYTHVELMPILEHPFDESWGYQVTGYFAPTSRFGTLTEFQWFVNFLHEANIGVILDWVPGHFPSDEFALHRFDGTALYEHVDPKQGHHPHWHTHIFNFGRREVTNFLIASALFWLQEMHIDGLRVDAVASMLYADYGRDEGEWVPNCFGGRENLEAIEFLKHLNAVVHEQVPGALMIAEESTAFPGVTAPVWAGGLGFDFKWNMGWMHDTLEYFKKDPIYRSYHQDSLTFSLLYAFSEQFILALSHDEVVHGKGSLLAKMPGDYWQRFANLRLLLGYQLCQPGPLLNFMGVEIGSWDEWSCKGTVPWVLLYFEQHRAIQRYVSEVNYFYRNHPALWQEDASYESFSWVDFSDHQNSVISYLRRGGRETLFCIHNFTPTTHMHYHFPLRGARAIREIFNSDALCYGGAGIGNQGGRLLVGGGGVACVVPPLATVIFDVELL